MSIYDHSLFYDVIFSTSWKAELDFLRDCFRKYGRKKTQSVFEPACGTGRLLWRLAKLGYEVTGLDLNENALAFCQKRLTRHGLSAKIVRGDMATFTLSDFGRKKPFDAAFNLVSSVLHLTTEEAARNHFRAMSNALKPGGLYVVGLHLQPQNEPAQCASEKWRVRRGSLELQSELKQVTIDRERRLETVEFRIRGTTPTKRTEVVDRFSLRTYTHREWLHLIRSATDFETAATFDFQFDIGCPLVLNETTEDAVFVLRKR